MNHKDTRAIFDILNQERAEQDRYEARVASAADKAALAVDFETIAMYRKSDTPLPARLAKIADRAWGRWIWG